MAERPTPHSVAVCTLIALYSDPSSLIHKENKSAPNSSGQAAGNDNDKRDEKCPGPTAAAAAAAAWSRAAASGPSLQEHLSKVIKHVVITNPDGWSTESNGCTRGGEGGGDMWNYRADSKTISLCSLLGMISGAASPEGSGSASSTAAGAGRSAAALAASGPFHHVARFLLDDLAQSCVSIDSLVDLFSALRSTVAKGVVDGDSAHGIYVRKRCLGFDELSFESVARFWEAFCVYVGTASHWGKRTPAQPSAAAASARHAAVHKAKIRRRVMAAAAAAAEPSPLGKNARLQPNTASSPSDHFHAAIESFPSDELTDELQASSLFSQCPGRASMPSSTSPSPAIPTNKWPLAPRQISRKLLQQCLALHKQLGRISYTQMEAHIQDILEVNPELILAHFLRFLNCALHGERVGALEHFHRYFDYAMIQERKDRSLWGTNVLSPSSANAAAVGAANQNPSSGSLHKNVVQYAAILLASLFHGFSNDELAHLATEEAVRVAQQSGDGSCLAFALGWLHATTDATASGLFTDRPANGYAHNGGAEMLLRAGSRAAANNLRALVSGTSLLCANYFASACPSSTVSRTNTTGNGSIVRLRGVPPLRIWESVAAASTDGGGMTVSSFNGNTLGTPLISHDTPTLMTNLDEGGDAMEIFAQQHLVSAGLWYSMGHNSMAFTTAHLTMRCYQHYLSTEHYAYLARKVACSVLYGTGSESNFFELKVSNETQSLSQSLQRLGLNTSHSSSYDSSALPPTKLQTRKIAFPAKYPVLYQTALEKLQSFQSKHNNMTNANSKHSLALLKGEWSIRLFDINAAMSYNALVYSFSPFANQNGIIATIEAMGQRSLLLYRKRNLEAAKYLILKEICPLCERNGFRAHRAHYLLQATLIELNSKTDDPVYSLHLILECLALSAEQSMDSIHATALSLLARLHLKLNNRGRAKAVLRAAMPTILQHAHVCFHGEAWLTMAKCSIGDAKASASSTDAPLSNNNNKRRRGCNYQRKSILLKEALLELNKAEISFEKVQDVVRLREVTYLQAQICNSIKGQHVKRNEAARKFQEMNCRIVQSASPIWHNAIASVLGGCVL